VTRLHAGLCAILIASITAGAGAQALPASGAVSPPPAPQAGIDAGPGGFTLRSADAGFTLRLRSLLQADGRFYSGEGPSADGFLLRRARIELTGTLYRAFDFRVMPEFAGSSTTILDAWLRWSLSPALQVQAGKVKQPVGLERAQSAENRLFNEFGYPTALVPNRDIGINVQGALGRGALSYYVGVFDGAPDGASVVTDSDDSRELAARLFATPVEGLGVGIAGTYGSRRGSAPSTYSTVGQQTFFRWRDGVTADGRSWRAVPQIYFYRGPFLLLGEYALSSHRLRLESTVRDADIAAWTFDVSWVLTGEKATYQGVNPRRPIGEGRGGLGAWQVALRATQLDIDSAVFPDFADLSRSADRARTAGIVVNWYLNRVVRFSLDYNHTELDGGAIDGENVVIGRAQLRF
jgi:phosphate-selective porin OprO/OprP